MNEDTESTIMLRLSVPAFRVLLDAVKFAAQSPIPQLADFLERRSVEAISLDNLRSFAGNLKDALIKLDRHNDRILSAIMEELEEYDDDADDALEA